MGLKKFYGDHFSIIDLAITVAVISAGSFLHARGWFQDYLSLGQLPSIYSSLMAGFLSILGFLITAQSIIYTVTPAQVVVRLKKSRKGKGVTELRWLFVAAALTLGIGFVFSLIGQVAKGPKPILLLIGWVIAGTVVYLALKLTQLVWLLSQIGKAYFDEMATVPSRQAGQSPQPSTHGH